MQAINLLNFSLSQDEFTKLDIIAFLCHKEKRL